MRKWYKTLTVLLVLLFSISTVSAKTLTERLADGHKLRLGFGTAVPWAYAGDNGEALGFVNMIALKSLKSLKLYSTGSIFKSGICDIWWPNDLNLEIISIQSSKGLVNKICILFFIWIIWFFF